MKHYIRVCRPRFEIAILEVDAPDFKQAEGLAPDIAAGLPDEGWTLLPFDEESYFPHVERCAPENELLMCCETATEKAEAIADMLAPMTDHSARYLLLMGITDDGEGKVIGEPWYRGDEPGLLEKDLTIDWLITLQSVASQEWVENDERTLPGHHDGSDDAAARLLERLLKARRDRKGGRSAEEES